MKLRYHRKRQLMRSQRLTAKCRKIEKKTGAVYIDQSVSKAQDQTFSDTSCVCGYV